MLVFLPLRDKVKFPLAPYKHEGKTIFPTGSWVGTYFSDELKAFKNEGYDITLISGCEFSKKHLFTDYVNHFYDSKKISSGPERFIAKRHLNQLYGIFGRKKDLIQTININSKDLIHYSTCRIIKSIIEINDKILALLFLNNINKDVIDYLNIQFDRDFNSFSVEVKSNVAIAAAVTSYARIHMIKLKLLCAKLGINILYSDTDSMITDKPLPNYLLGKDLGLLKDELNGCIIEEGYFLGIKQYGYYYFDSKGDRIEKSVFAGIIRDSVSFKEIKDIFNGETVTKDILVRFYKSFKTLNIKINPTKVSIKFNSNKKLVNNKSVPIKVINLKHNLDNRPLFFKLKNRITKFLKRLFK